MRKKHYLSLYKCIIQYYIGVVKGEKAFLSAVFDKKGRGCTFSFSAARRVPKYERSECLGFRRKKYKKERCFIRSAYIFAARLRCASVVARRGFPDTNEVSVGGPSRQPVHTNPGEGQATTRHVRVSRAAGVTVCGTKPSTQCRSVTLRAGDSACSGLMFHSLRLLRR